MTPADQLRIRSAIARHGRNARARIATELGWALSDARLLPLASQRAGARARARSLRQTLQLLYGVGATEAERLAEWCIVAAARGGPAALNVGGVVDLGLRGPVIELAATGRRRRYLCADESILEIGPGPRYQAVAQARQVDGGGSDGDSPGAVPSYPDAPEKKRGD